ncbi:hypothetical protein QBC34DRAFT_474596 [Podospora aff. communis PSN243]|uniref:Rhodanese domain-containing protein n=1 Tax=Podospora aff. communis PSN243 TaxID=3040156 RepID=A0AAV9G913_9PEZI|nr:hypothetical protein QBC34DRAFT_474596 [Podospora aff. communis PSN243]
MTSITKEDLNLFIRYNDPKQETPGQTSELYKTLCANCGDGYKTQDKVDEKAPPPTSPGNFGWVEYTTLLTLLEKKRSSVVLVDCRNETEYTANHLIGALAFNIVPTGLPRPEGWDALIKLQHAKEALNNGTGPPNSQYSPTLQKLETLKDKNLAVIFYCSFGDKRSVCAAAWYAQTYALPTKKKDSTEMTPPTRAGHVVGILFGGYDGMIPQVKRKERESIQGTGAKIDLKDWGKDPHKTLLDQAMARYVHPKEGNVKDWEVHCKCVGS